MNALSSDQKVKQQTLIAYLKNRQNSQNATLSVMENVLKFKNKTKNKKLYAGISNSQWGTIYHLAGVYKDSPDLKEIFDAETGALYTGQAREIWAKDTERAADLKEATEHIMPENLRALFLQRLAREMTK